MKSVVVAVLLVLGITGYISYNAYNKIECTTEPIPFTSSTEANPLIYESPPEVDIKGVNGKKQVCVQSRNNKVVSEKVIDYPTNELIQYGTKPREPIYTAPEPQEDVIPSWARSVCNDGTYSASVGRGTCSHHAGVAYYL